MPGDGVTIRRPGLPLFLTEPLRGVVSLAALPLASPWLARAPHGDGHGVLVLPGLLATDVSTVPLRGYLRLLGYRVRGWELGRNIGPSSAVLDGLPRAAERWSAETGGPVSVVGWSLGGIFARELARDRPDLVRQVITLGAPFALVDTRQSRADAAYRSSARRHAQHGRVPTRSQLRLPIGVPSTAVYSTTDGIVHWTACVQDPTEQHENVGVRCGHLGLGVDAAAWWVIANRLSQPAGQWQPFRPPASLRGWYPRTPGVA